MANNQSQKNEHFSGVGTAIISVILTAIASYVLFCLTKEAKLHEDYCIDVYKGVYKDANEIENALLSEAKKNILRRDFQTDIENISDKNKGLENSIIKFLEGYIYLDAKCFNHDSKLGTSCIDVEESNFNRDEFRTKHFEQKCITGDYRISNTDIIQKGGLKAFLIDQKDSIKINVIKQNYPLLKNADKNFIKSMCKDFHADIDNIELGILKYTVCIYPTALLALTNDIPNDTFGKNSVVNKIGKDSEQRFAQFEFIYISNEYNWKKSSFDKVEVTRSNKKVEVAGIDEIKSEEMKTHITGNLTDIIFVGAASCEGKGEKEIRRAGLRASQMYCWFYESYKDMVNDKKITLHTLNLGQSKANCEKLDNTGLQRRFVIIGVKNKDKDVNIEQALNDILERADAPIRLADYQMPKDAFDMNRLNTSQLVEEKQKFHKDE